ncbi:hypothetical protein JCM10212_002132 [Sporobolomyces blumeae]
MHVRIAYSPPPPGPDARPDASSSSSSFSPPAPPTSFGTVLYRGPVRPTKGEWLGVEWDDPGRGKHSGVHEPTGVRYFTTRVEGAGSFLRPKAPGLVLEGSSFKQAFEAKYLGEVDSSATSRDATIDDRTTMATTLDPTATTSEFFKTSSNFEIEVVSSDKVAERFRHLGRLREAGLDGEPLSYACRTGDDRSQVELTEFGNRLSRLEVLDLSCCLLPRVDEAERIAAVLPKLSTLVLNSNRFERIPEPILLPGFNRLAVLRLNNTLVTWAEVVRIAPSLINLVELQLGFNRIDLLDAGSRGEDPSNDSALLPALKVLNLESNELSDWPGTVQAMSRLPSLEHLVLASNRFSHLVLAPSVESSVALRNLRHLSLSENILSSWSDSIDALADSSASNRFPSLVSLRLSDNPLSTTASRGTVDDRSAVHARLLAIARMPFLTSLEGTPITAGEREDAERIWIKTVDEDPDSFDMLGDGSRRRLEDLRAKYYPTTVAEDGAGDARKAASSSKDTVKSRLIRLAVLASSAGSDAPVEFDPHSELSILPNARTLLVRSQLSKLLNKPLPKSKYRLVGWTRTRTSGTTSEAVEKVGGGEEERWIRVEIPVKEEGKEVAWWGLEDGDGVSVEPV